MMHDSQELFDHLHRTVSTPLGRTRTPFVRTAESQREPNSLFIKATADVKPTPLSILFVRCDSYGDLILFSPVLTWLRLNWPQTRLGLLMKARHEDLIPLLPTGVECLTFRSNPFTESALAPACVNEVSGLVQQFDPEILVAPCFDKTWVEAVAAAAVPQARRISVGPARYGAIWEFALRRQQIEAAYPEQVEIDRQCHEMEKNRALLCFLNGAQVDLADPILNIPSASLFKADALLTELGLRAGAFMICNPAGVSNTAVKSWPASNFAEVIRWLAQKHRIPVLVAAHEKERSIVDEVARLLGKTPKPAIWLGQDGEFALLAALASRARWYFGNDTSTFHVAEAVGVPSVVVFGGGTYPRFSCRHPGSISFVHPLPCFGCKWDCHLGEALCLKLVRPQDVISHWEKSLRRKTPVRSGIATVELDELSAEARRQIALSRKVYDQIQEDRESRFIQILDLTTLVHEKEKDRSAEGSYTEGLRSELEKLRAGDAALHVRLADAENAIRAREQQLTEVSAQRTATEARACVAEAQSAELSAKLQAAGDALSAKEFQLSEHKAQLDHSRTEFDALARRQEETLLQLGQHQAEAARLASELAQREQQESEVEAKLRESVAAIEAAATERQTLQARLADAENAIRTREQQLTEVSAQRTAAEARAGVAEARSTELSAQLHAAGEALAAKESELSERQALSVNQLRDIERLRRELHQGAIQTAHNSAREEALVNEIALMTRVLAGWVSLAGEFTSASRGVAFPALPPATGSALLCHVDRLSVTNNEAVLEGWAFQSTGPSCREIHHAILVKAPDQGWFAFPAARVSRDDVARHFQAEFGNTLDLELSGFRACFPCDLIPASRNVEIVVTLHSQGGFLALSSTFTIPLHEQ